jgi:2'-5' RNA ligase
VSGIARAFVAVVPPPDVLDTIERVVEPLRSHDAALRWLPREQWHVTVEFLGRVRDAEPLVAGLTRVATGVQPFEARLGGAGAFPKVRRASVVWVGVESDGLTALADAVGDLATTLGHARDARPFRPHITVARASKPRPVDRAVDGLRAGSLGPPWSVGDVVLFDSETLSSGAVHTERARFALGVSG